MGCAKHYVGDGGTVAEMRDAGFEQFDEGVVRIRLDQGDTAVRRGDACAGCTSRRTCRALAAGRRHDHAVLQQLERREVLRPASSC